MVLISSPSFYQPEEKIFSLIGDFNKAYFNIFTESDRDLNYFIDHNLLLNNFGINEWWASLRFDLLGVISPTTPRLSMDPPMLFYHESVKHFYKEHSDAEANQIVIGINKLFKKIEAKGGTPIFVPIPEKFTVYHHLAGEMSNSIFYPQMITSLQESEIEVVDFYAKLSDLESTYYWPSDTHLNIQGYNLLVNAIYEKVIER